MKQKLSLEELSNLWYISFLTSTIYIVYGIYIVAPQDIGVDNLFYNIIASNVGEIIGYLIMS